MRKPKAHAESLSSRGSENGKMKRKATEVKQKEQAMLSELFIAAAIH